MRLVYSQNARKQLKKLPKNQQIKILKKIEKLKLNPYAGKKLKGSFKELYSLKIWPYRIIYRLFSKRKTLFINVIQHRQSAYN